MAAKDESPMQPTAFEWQNDVNGIYQVAGRKCSFIANGTALYRPVAAAALLRPHTGKHYNEISVNGDNMRLGLATDDADLSGEMGKAKGLYSLDLPSGVCSIDGQELKRLWRLVVPVSGGHFGFCWDSDKGLLQVWFNGEFAGTCFHSDFGLKGKTVRPIVGIAGVESNNRDIGVGMKSAVVEDPARVPKPVLSQ
jgi:hypothetical protein